MHLLFDSILFQGSYFEELSLVTQRTILFSRTLFVNTKFGKPPKCSFVEELLNKL